MGKFDLPAVFNYILTATGKEKLVYIGFSMGIIKQYRVEYTFTFPILTTLQGRQCFLYAWYTIRNWTIRLNLWWRWDRSAHWPVWGAAFASPFLLRNTFRHVYYIFNAGSFPRGYCEHLFNIFSLFWNDCSERGLTSLRQLLWFNSKRGFVRRTFELQLFAKMQCSTLQEPIRRILIW